MNRNVIYHQAFQEKCKINSDYLELLRNGTVMTKFHSTSKWREHKLYLDDKEMKVYHKHSFKKCHRADYEIDLIDIIEVRKGWKTDTFNKIESKIEKYRRRSEESDNALARKKSKKFSFMDEGVCFSIVHGNDRKSLDLAAESKEIAEVWVITLQHIVTVLKELEHTEQYDRWLKKQFEGADIDKSGGLNFSECCKLLQQLNIKMQIREAKKLFDKANTRKLEIRGEQVLDDKEFIDFFFSLMKRTDIEAIFKRYSGNAKEMNATDLCDFLKIEQGMADVTNEKCWHLISTFEPSGLKEKGSMSLIGFTQLLLSEQGEIFNNKHNVIYQDMTFPLSHYYIASSHNTYLTGGQLSGESSVEGYIQALRDGCRCVELDIWDGPDDEPIIYHGYTLTTKILLRDVLSDAIYPHAFKSSEYPLILSLENHCTEAQQERIAYHLKHILKDMLYLEPVDENMEFLPSPEALKRKIIVKAKKKSNTHDEDEENDSEISDEHDETCKKPAAVDVHLSDLVNICQAVHFHGFRGPAEGKCYQMSSFSESKAEKLIQNERENFIIYNTKQLSRIYPSGTRTESSNYKPLPFWSIGCQIVALNYQSDDKPMFFNEAKFRQNGNCGYVLKPDYLRDPKIVRNTGKRVVLKLKVISGQYIPKPDQSLDGEIVDPYVKAEILGHESDKKKLKTRPVRNNGFNPIWDCNMEFIINMPEIAILMFTVKDFSSSGVNKKLGQYAIPLSSVNTGYRHVYLMDYSRKYLIPSSIFVHIALSRD
ncbi:1-phosphatidylinositol 4,5-bisphosphate phosphodiesterase delta-4-like isoform X2 [Ischnura elegans]|uniref:1-phosphatidylinositol 4,5-bisphosphate phosphodiesterase delta-4-like isoform X2 n=1 Tax=Ischnura elegans TaxID=197161 RepID=UPI001ED86B2E|nr:1-phosphatidylinositol 4,5-bisphosphate phosphodiesterase delta-4-like isoform X2 [Ischnura elegans]